ncbi:hypothetical protein ERJ75_000246600 [Trypanosoma vivax]|uniref:AAA+ ATPase domain-containing protein n=1 Tax=Trypanosoma vivax (strain Y486) TaxID=1055687 RepID=G0U1S8_TRYVY|nr:hypothetical protein TRVL_08233 [Trypanosoma vivax]KAH8618596.1 hypothetical protein ERJ75_000246600 [Trypanosoma vivax]CCC50227.1 conserved hypothetical protein [Trypanosoma vivax Y486]
MEQTPLFAREHEYDSVLRFIEERLLLLHCKSLFVYGACGSGKTSTVLRAVRRISHRTMTCDKNTVGTNTGSRNSSCSGRSSSADLPSMRAGKANRQRANKRERDYIDVEAFLEESAPTGTKEAQNCPSASSEGAESSGDPAVMFPYLFGKSRRVQCHYVNCADMSARQLASAISDTFRNFTLRPDAQTRTLISAVERIPQQVAALRRRGREALVRHQILAGEGAHVGLGDGSTPTAAAGSARSTAQTPLHVLVLDEVEYMHTAARGTLAALSELSVERASQLALVFISNVRELVHVPYMLLKELPFRAYSSEALEHIGARIVAGAELPRDGQDGVRFSPALLSFIARKALLESSGDARQVAVMCRRLVHTAQQELMEQKKKETLPKSRSSLGDAESPRRLSNQMSALSDCSSPTSPAATVTLAQGNQVLGGHAAVSKRVFEYVASMPEQMLYVLSCLVVLTLRQKRDSEVARVSIGGTTQTARRHRTETSASSSFFGPGSSEPGHSEPGTFTMRAVHRLYTSLMNRQRFPSMNAAGISSAVGGFADIGIISRPQRRGNEEVFSFNGTWSLDSMQAALLARGEALRQERIKCGLDAAENRFDEVLRELKNIVAL